MTCSMSLRFVLAIAIATTMASLGYGQASFLGPNEDSDLGDCCFVGVVEDGEVDFEIEMYYLEDEGGAWEKFPAIEFGPDTDFPNSIPVGTVVKVIESITINEFSPGISEWHEHLRADSIVYEAYGESIGDEGALDGVYTAQWVEGSATATLNGNDILASVVYNNQDDDSTVSLYFNQVLGGNGSAVTFEITKEFRTASEIPLYHPDDVNQQFPGGVAYIAMPEFPGPNITAAVPEPTTCTALLLCGLLVAPVARRRCA